MVDLIHVVFILDESIYVRVLQFRLVLSPYGRAAVLIIQCLGQGRLSIAACADGQGELSRDWVVGRTLCLLELAEFKLTQRLEEHVLLTATVVT